MSHFKFHIKKQVILYVMITIPDVTKLVVYQYIVVINICPKTNNNGASVHNLKCWIMTRQGVSET